MQSNYRECPTLERLLKSPRHHQVMGEELRTSIWKTAFSRCASRLSTRCAVLLQFLYR